MTNEELYDAAKEAIDNLFGDKSVSVSQCKENLNSLIGEIEIMINTLELDESNEEG
jgi:hypothetical protein